MGYWRVRGELLVLGVTVASSAVQEILRKTGDRLRPGAWPRPCCPAAGSFPAAR